MDGVKSLNRVLDILEFISESPRPASLSEINEKTGLPKSTACRMLSVLEERGYASKNRDTGRYSPGLKILTLTSMVINSLDIVKTARPFLKELSDKTAETVHLLAPQGDWAVYVDKIEYPNTIRLDSRVGKRVPLYCTAAGKALLAHMDAGEIESYLGRIELKNFTKNTITDPAIIVEELKRIRRKGFSADNMEYEDNVRCVAAPVRNRSAGVIAAVSISGPTIRIKQKDIAFLAGAITEFSVKISKSLGHVSGEDKIL